MAMEKMWAGRFQKALDKKADDFNSSLRVDKRMYAQAQGFTELAVAIKQHSHKSIWCYTGYRFEELLQNPAQKALLEQIDVLVDGRFIEALKDEGLRFRGSSNQRIINVPASLEKGETVVMDI